MERLGVIEFGRELVESGDLDPLYIALWKSGMPREKLSRWLVAYWCYYHAGLCCWVVDQPDFYSTMVKVANGGTDYPRGTERRHFRGQLALSSVLALQKQFPKGATQLLGYLLTGDMQFKEVYRRVRTLYGFGHWIAWKVPDMLERLDLAPVRFLTSDLEYMFKTSKEGAMETCRACSLSGNDLLTAHWFIRRKLGALLSPPRYERRINVQETETIFCKWKSHLGGHYELGKDTRDIVEGLERYKQSKTSRRLLTVLKGLPYAA